jgi:ketosteroid isomerase-like protein
MKRAVIGALSLVVILPITARAQGWSAEQQDVWRTVEAYWGHLTRGEVAEFTSYFHDNFSGWVYNADRPRTKEDVVASAQDLVADYTFLRHEINPVGVMVHGDVAVAHYYFSYEVEDASGAVTHEEGRWTDVLVREGDIWMCIGDHGGSR